MVFGLGFFDVSFALLTIQATTLWLSNKDPNFLLQKHDYIINLIQRLIQMLEFIMSILSYIHLESILARQDVYHPQS